MDTEKKKAINFRHSEKKGIEYQLNTVRWLINRIQLILSELVVSAVKKKIMASIANYILKNSNIIMIRIY